MSNAHLVVFNIDIPHFKCQESIYSLWCIYKADAFNLIFSQVDILIKYLTLRLSDRILNFKCRLLNSL